MNVMFGQEGKKTNKTRNRRGKPKEINIVYICENVEYAVIAIFHAIIVCAEKKEKKNLSFHTDFELHSDVIYTQS